MSFAPNVVPDGIDAFSVRNTSVTPHLRNLDPDKLTRIPRAEDNAANDGRICLQSRR